MTDSKNRKSIRDAVGTEVRTEPRTQPGTESAKSASKGSHLRLVPDPKPFHQETTLKDPPPESPEELEQPKVPLSGAV